MGLIIFIAFSIVFTYVIIKYSFSEPPKHYYIRSEDFGSLGGNVLGLSFLCKPEDEVFHVIVKRLGNKSPPDRIMVRTVNDIKEFTFFIDPKKNWFIEQQELIYNLQAISDSPHLEVYKEFLFFLDHTDPKYWGDTRKFVFPLATKRAILRVLAFSNKPNKEWLS